MYREQSGNGCGRGRGHGGGHGDGFRRCLLTYCIPTDEFIMSVPRRYYAHKILVTR